MCLEGGLAYLVKAVPCYMRKKCRKLRKLCGYSPTCDYPRHVISMRSLHCPLRDQGLDIIVIHNANSQFVLHSSGDIKLNETIFKQ